ncbi:glycosyltransferase family 2 protein [Parabacteroides johnsonii]|jgi:glycoslytransferase|uniref:glycosyltransferase family 2 protein n=1 Tax=Parabacteroides johnsonii TaxID=387661 RepID=UPI00307EDB47
MKSIKISFLITFYNQENYVKDCLNSILLLDLPVAYEVIVCDDGSFDNTLVEIEKFKNKFSELKIFKNDRNPTKRYNPIRRVSLSRLRNLDNAQGEYLVFIDGDDMVVNRLYYLEGIKFLDQNANVNGYAGNFRYLNANNPDNDNTDHPKEGLINFETYLERYYLHVGGFIFRRSISRDTILKLKKIENFDDGMIAFAHLYDNSFFFKNVVSYHYRQNSSSIWNDSSSIYKDLLQLLDFDVFCEIFDSKYRVQAFRRNYAPFKRLLAQGPKVVEILTEEKVETLLQWTSLLKRSIVRRLILSDVPDRLALFATFAYFKTLSAADKLLNRILSRI